MGRVANGVDISVCCCTWHKLKQPCGLQVCQLPPSQLPSIPRTVQIPWQVLMCMEPAESWDTSVLLCHIKRAAKKVFLQFWMWKRRRCKINLAPVWSIWEELALHGILCSTKVQLQPCSAWLGPLQCLSALLSATARDGAQGRYEPCHTPQGWAPAWWRGGFLPSHQGGSQPCFLEKKSRGQDLQTKQV